MSLIPNMEFLRCLPRVIDRKMINLAPNRGSKLLIVTVHMMFDQRELRGPNFCYKMETNVERQPPLGFETKKHRSNS